MATIVRLPEPRARRFRRQETEGGAAILFFTGVRYVRDADPDVEDEPEAGLDREPPPSVQDTGLLAIV